MIKVDECLYKHWIHSREEDTEFEKVYRASTYKFPRSRGRNGFEIRGNGEVILYKIGPTDKSEEVYGTFTFDDSNNLEVNTKKGTPERIIMTILSCEGDKLVIKK
jgi:hypothetical protein